MAFEGEGGAWGGVRVDKRKRMRSSAWNKAPVGLAQRPRSDTKLLSSDTSPPRSGLGPFPSDKALLSDMRPLRSEMN